MDDTRRFNLREGLTPTDDHLPKRFYFEALPDGQKIITKVQMEQLLRDYYSARGWDDTGKPS